MHKIYLSNIPRKKALQLFLGQAPIKQKHETVPTIKARDRITSGPVFAALSMPGYHAAAMDGIAVRAENTFTASDQKPLTLPPGEGYINVNTGNPLPSGFNAVIKIEDIQLLPDGSAEILAPATPWQYVRPVGEDLVAGEMIVPAHHRLRPPDLGALIAGGIEELEVMAKPRVTVIPSGSELVAPGAKRSRGSIPDFNSTVIASYLNEWGAEPQIYPVVPDDREAIKAAVRKALPESDLVIINAGSSAGDKDFTYSVLEELGETFVHGVATRPGKPTILGKAEGKPVVGLPGYPVSAYMSLEWFVLPLIFNYYGLPLPVRPQLKVTLGRRLVSEAGVEEFIRMTIGYVNGKYIANPLTRGAGVTMSLVKADGLLVIPANSLGYEQEEEVIVELYRPETELRYNLLASGSHDLIIDLLGTALRERSPQINLSSAHLGSLGGITAVGRGQAHLAGVHLFDPDSKSYNISYIEKMLPGQTVHLVNLVYRMQGWIVPKGNPANIESVKDLVNKKLSFINRQRGAGTRLLFDYLLEESGLEPNQIYGYEREEHTHLNVAAAVAAGTAAVGLGILPAARAFNLDFIPLVEERYDLLLSDSFYKSESAELLMNIIKDPAFQKQVEEMGGYSMRDAGRKEL